MNLSMSNEVLASTSVILDAGERVKRFGIEVHGPTAEDGITFLAGHWAPGGEVIIFIFIYIYILLFVIIF